MTTKQTIDGVLRKRAVGTTKICGLYYPAECIVCGWIGSSEDCTEDDAQCTQIRDGQMCLGDTDEVESRRLLEIIQTEFAAKAQVSRADLAANCAHSWPDLNSIHCAMCGTPRPAAAQPQGEPVAYDPAKENKQFEAWARTQSQVDLRLCDIGLYYARKTGLAHDAWQHRAKLA